MNGEKAAHAIGYIVLIAIIAGGIGWSLVANYS